MDPKPVVLAPHSFRLVHFSEFTWCKFCTKFIWGLGKQGYSCRDCKYPAHTKCVRLVPNNCTMQPIKDVNSKKNIVTQNRFQNMNDLVNAMQNPQTGIKLKERKQLLKSYSNTFTAEEAVDWMLTNLPIRDREDAVGLAQKMYSSKYIKHITDPKKGFKDGDGVYIFEDLEKVSQMAEDASSASDETAPEKSEVYSHGITKEDFTELALIGKGGFGKVIKVEKKDTKKVYAMKVMMKTKISGPRQLQCLIAEKNIMLNDNPFLIHLHYSFQTADKLYFVMDYISGGDLAFHLERKVRFNEKEARHIAAEIVLALEHLHSCGIIYRDLKLENILLDDKGHVCLTDFGLSKELNSVTDTTVTVCGTPTYLAPEVLLGQPYGNSIDWWSLGVVMYELFTGSNPFDGQDFNSVLNNILHAPIVIPAYVPVEGKNLMEKLLQRNPAKRICSGVTGSVEIQNHPFFEDIDWKKLMVKTVKPPYAPKPEDNHDPRMDEENYEPPEGKGTGKIVVKDFGFDGKTIVP